MKEVKEMNKEEKVKLAKEVYEKIGLTDIRVGIYRDEEINADYVWVPDTRGPGGLIIGDDGTFLFCQSAKDFSYWKEEYKKGIRSNK